MKIVPVIALFLLALFFGIYAMTLELRNMNNLDQIVLAVLFGVLTFLAGKS